MADDSEAKGELQFDTVVAQTAAAATEPAAGVTCAVCRRTIEQEYYDINGSQVCDTCRDLVTHQAETPRAWGLLFWAIGCGVVAAIAGAAVYYAVIALTNFEIGIVAILIGYMVGYAINWATGGRGGRRFQVVAIVLTYWAVGLAYSPLAFKEFRSGDKASTAIPAGATSPAPATLDEPARDRSLILAVVALVGFTLVLPVLVVAGSLPGGLISAVIIGIGMRQAWRMTGAPQLKVSGPYRMGPVSPAAGS